MAGWTEILCWIEKHPGLASWLQAIGAIVAIFWAIWIAHRDTRERRNTARVVATITAANMQHRLQALAQNLNDAKDALSTAVAGKQAYGHVQKAIADLRSCPIFTNEEIAQLSPLGGSALCLAKIQSAIGNTIGILQNTTFDTNYYTIQSSAESTVDPMYMEHPLNVLQVQKARLDHVQAELHLQTGSLR